MKLFKNPLSFFCGDRDAKFDLLKLWALLSVILDHSLQRWIVDCQKTQLYNFIFLSQMPIFMYVAGFFAFFQGDKIYRADVKRIVVMFLRRLMNLFIPFISFAIIKSIIVQDFSNIYLCFFYPQLSLWFIYSLMWMEILIMASQVLSNLLIKNNEIVRELIPLVIYVVLLTPFIVIFLKKIELFDSKLICYYSIYFIFGYFWHFLANRIRLEKKVVAYAIAFLTCLICLISVMILRPNIIFDNETLINTLFRVVGSIACIILIYIICFCATKLRAFRLASKIGRLSLEFYYVHLLVLLIPLFVSKVDNYFTFIGLYLMVIVVSFLIIMVLKSNLITDFICFGKLSKNKRGREI